MRISFYQTAKQVESMSKKRAKRPMLQRVRKKSANAPQRPLGKPASADGALPTRSVGTKTPRRAFGCVEFNCTAVDKAPSAFHYQLPPH